MDASLPFGPRLRDWRQRRRLSQLELATDARISTRHLSFIENGRARPSRGMVLHLAELLEVPLRERNALLLAAGFSPAFPAHALDDAPMAAAMDAVALVLDAHGAFPATAVDRHWNLLRANAAAMRLVAGVSATLMTPPVNVLRLTLHPEGLAPAIVNFASLREHMLGRLLRQARSSGDVTLLDLHAELAGYPVPDAIAEAGEWPDPGHTDPGVVIPLHLRLPQGELRLFSTITVFGTPVDVTLAELAVEAFFPADAATRQRLEAMAAGTGPTATTD